MSVKTHEAFSMDSFQDRLLWFDDFHGDQLQDEWRETGEAGGSAAVIDLQVGGVVRLTTDTDTNDKWIIDWNNIASLHVSKRVSMEIRAKVNQATYVSVGFVLQFDMGNRIFFFVNEILGGATNWRILCIDGGAQTNLDSGVALDTDYHIFRFECHLHGGSHVHFYIDGVETANSPITTNIPDDAGDYFNPWLQIQTRENVAKSMDMDYVYIRQERD